MVLLPTNVVAQSYGVCCNPIKLLNPVMLLLSDIVAKSYMVAQILWYCSNSMELLQL